MMPGRLVVGRCGDDAWLIGHVPALTNLPSMKPMQAVHADMVLNVAQNGTSAHDAAAHSSDVTVT